MCVIVPSPLRPFTLTSGGTGAGAEGGGGFLRRLRFFPLLLLLLLLFLLLSPEEGGGGGGDWFDDASLVDVVEAQIICLCRPKTLEG